jgi:hypothetical protein
LSATSPPDSHCCWPSIVCSPPRRSYARTPTRRHPNPAELATRERYQWPGLIPIGFLALVALYSMALGVRCRWRRHDSSSPPFTRVLRFAEARRARTGPARHRVALTTTWPPRWRLRDRVRSDQAPTRRGERRALLQQDQRYEDQHHRREEPELEHRVETVPPCRVYRGRATGTHVQIVSPTVRMKSSRPESEAEMARRLLHFGHGHPCLCRDWIGGG